LNVSRSEAERLLGRARQLIRAEAAGIIAVESQIDHRLIDLAERVVATPGKVLVAGVGTSGEVARRMAHLLAVTGTPSLFIHPADALHGRLGAITSDDIVLVISKGGQSTDVNQFARLARERGAYVVALTGDESSGLADAASAAVAIESGSEAEPGGIVAMGSTLVVSAWGDALALVVMEMRGYAWQDVMLSHPGGAVGQLSAPSEDS